MTQCLNIPSIRFSKTFPFHLPFSLSNRFRVQYIKGIVTEFFDLPKKLDLGLQIIQVTDPIINNSQILPGYIWFSPSNLLPNLPQIRFSLIHHQTIPSEHHKCGRMSGSVYLNLNRHTSYLYTTLITIQWRLRSSMLFCNTEVGTRKPSE